MAKITPRKEKEVISVKTMPASQKANPSAWWKAGSQAEMAQQLLSTAAFLKEQSQYRYRQASIYSRLYGNMPLFGWAGSSISKLAQNSALPIDRPTMSVITSCVDTLVSRLTQSRPRPIFLTDNGDYRERNLGKQLNQFIAGELYQTKAYRLGEIILRDAAVLGTGCIKILRDSQDRVALERRLLTELLMDPNDSLYGDPRQLYEVQLIDRSVLAAMFPEKKSSIQKAEQAYPDSSGETSKTVSDLVMVVEGWHLPSAKNADDGMHTIACSEGLLSSDEYKKDKFPFVFLQYSPRLLGPWGQGLSEQLMGTQTEINKLLITISQAINLVGVPRVFVEKGSKVVKAHLNNQIGSIVEYSGTKPEYTVAPCVPQELYAQLQRLVDYAYQQSGVSALAANSQKPAGLDSGAALREYDDLQSDRFAALSRRYDQLFIDLAYAIIDEAKDICEDTGKYQTVYPGKNGIREIDLPAASLLDNPFVIQCYDASSLPRDPAGRLEKVVEMMQAGIVDPQEGRRLLDFPDIQQEDKLAMAAEERIFQILDEIIDSGTYTPPDPFMDLAMAEKRVVQYYNQYAKAKLEEKKLGQLRDFFAQVQALKGQAAAALAPPPGQMAPGGSPPLATPQAPPESALLPTMPGAA